MSREPYVVCFEKTHCERPQRYEQNHIRADLEKPISRSFIKSLEGDTLSKAFKKSNCNNKVANFFRSRIPLVASGFFFFSVPTIKVFLCRTKKGLVFDFLDGTKVGNFQVQLHEERY